MIDKIAEFMGWQVAANGEIHDILIRAEYPGAGYRIIKDFRPTEDWNDWMLVEQRIREQGLYGKYISFLMMLVLLDMETIEGEIERVKAIMSATLEQRASALERVLEERDAD